MRAKEVRYAQIIKKIFENNYRKGDREVEFKREEINGATSDLGLPRIKNLGDLIYTYSKLRNDLPESIQKCAPKGKVWIVIPVGRGVYRFVAGKTNEIRPRPDLTQIKIPDSTPGLIKKYAMSDEQALLAKVRYNKLLDIFTCVTCYSLQSHFRTTVEGFGQAEADEVYVGVHREGAHFAFVVEAKGGDERLSVAQLVQVAAIGEEKFGAIISRPIAAQFIETDVIALFELRRKGYEIEVVEERHYRLVDPKDLSAEELREYRERIDPT